jgi:hypothetical protein
MEEVTSPDDLNKPSISWGDPTAGNSVYTVDLVQGQHDDVGDVSVEQLSDGGLKIIYLIDSERDCAISEVHVDIAKSAGTTPFSIDFNVNSQNSPMFGNFDSKDLGTIDATNPKAVSVTFTLSELKLALGIATTATVPAKIYLAVHGVVCCNESPAGYICPDDLPSSAIIEEIIYPEDYYMGLTFDQVITNGQEYFNGWCIDLSRPLSAGLNQSVKFVCSYTPITDTCLVENPENLKKANWIINNREGWSKAAVQAALWYLLENINGDDYDWTATPLYANSGYMDLVNAADPTFEPTCGQKVLVIIYQNVEDPCMSTFQIAAIEVDAPCVENCETAMAFDYPTDLTSALFPGAKWFRYISFNYLTP